LTHFKPEGEMPMASLVELRDVRKVYNGHQESVALGCVSLTIPTGQATSVMGPSGSGKSTLLNLIGGLDRPSSGAVMVGGQDLGRLNEAALARFRRSQVGIVFQFFNLLNNLSALDNVMVPAQLAGVTRAQARRRALDLLWAARYRRAARPVSDADERRPEAAGRDSARPHQRSDAAAGR
jgi:putative ABC transport system ATP-binding protein